MSEAATYRYRLEEQRRRELEEARTREVASRAVSTCDSALEQIREQGFSLYVPSELAQAQHRLAAIRASLHANPQDTQRKAVELQAVIARLRSLGAAVKQRMEEEAKRRAQEVRDAQDRATAEIRAFLQEQLTAFADPVVRDFAFQGIRALQGKICRNIGPNQLMDLKNEIRQELAAISTDAEIRAEKWKARKAAELEAKTRETMIEMAREQIAADVKENPDGIKKALAQLDAVRESIERGNQDQGSVTETIHAIVANADAAVMVERIRKETVKAIMRSLGDVGLVIVGKPTIVRNDHRDEVVILARKAPGHEATFRVSLDGAFVYRFDGYEGAACKKDITGLQRRMQDIYGVKLSDKRTIWENPDRLTADAYPASTDMRRKGHD